MTAIALALLILFWLLAGILFSGAEITIYNIPLWAIVGTIGVWTFAIAIAITLSRRINNA